MSRRCRPGLRARILRGPNAGKIVVVVKRYFGERVSDGRWPEALFPWVATSTSGPLRFFSLDSRREVPPRSTIVVDDRNLEPLQDDDSEETGEGESSPSVRPAQGIDV